MCRRQELRDLRLLQKEEHRAQALLNTKLDAQKEQMQRRFDQEMNVGLDTPTHTDKNSHTIVLHRVGYPRLLIKK